MKRMIVLFTAAVLALALVSCGGSSEGSAPVSDNTESSASYSSENVSSEKETPVDDVASSLESLNGADLSDAIDKINDAEYTASYYADGVDFTDFIDDVKDDYVVGSISVDAENKTVTVDVALKENEKADEDKDKLSEKLEIGSAWIAVENYGEDQYPYGFELHYLAGKLAEEAEDDNTWFLKAECTVTNEYGAEADMTCEAEVTGTNSAPEIVYFSVY